MTTRTFRGVRLLRFGPFELDLRAAELRKYGVRIRLQEQPFRILVMLLERSGEVVLRDELRKRLWPNDTVVEVGHGINAAILRLREALGESAENPRYIETLARRGYRFQGEVEVVYKNLEPEPGLSPAAPALDTGDLQGKTLSHFAVMEKLGGGGMGVVYRAQDLTLGRQVALKFLPRDLAGDAAALSRFQREARAASALNHPNVCTVYGVEQCEGQPVIVMEMIEGETLAARLANGPLPIHQSLTLAIQVAGALDAAHRQSIVHRDLKPSNLLVTRSGVKVLDFGLAKIGRSASSEAPGAAAQGIHVTRHGAIMGTPQYMSPEQMQGKETDARSDIFALGLVLYEMLTGRRALEGDTSAMMQASLQTEAVELPENAGPLAVRRLIRRCLARDPEERWQSARDLREALEWIAAEARPAPIAPARRRVPKWIYAAAAAVLLLGLLIPGAREVADRSRGVKREPAVSNLSSVAGNIPAAPLPSADLSLPGAEFNHFSVSPDGRSLAYVSGGNLLVRDLATGTTRQLAGSLGAGKPFWSPDGLSLALATGSLLQRYSLVGGPPSIVCSIRTNIAGLWAPDGTILIGQLADGIYRVPAAGGVPVRITDLDAQRGETRHLAPALLPGGRFLYVAGAMNRGESELFAATVGSTGRTAILPVSSNAVYVPSHENPQRGYLVYVKDRLLLAQGFDAGLLRITGRPSVIAGNVTLGSAAGAAVVLADFSAAGDTLVYRSMSAEMVPRVLPASSPLAMAPRPNSTLIVLRKWMAGLR